jgi:signal transduction histidine kinase
MQKKISQHFLKTQEDVRRLSVSFMAIVIGVMFLLLCSYFYYSSLKKFNEENERIKKNYIELQKNLVKTRVDQAYSFIESIRFSAEERLKETLKSRVYEAYNAASFIYEKYKNKESDASIKQRIKDALAKMKYEDGKSYVWVTDYNNIAVTYPTNSKMEGTYIGDVKDQKGNYTIKNQTNIAKTQKEGFIKDYYSKHGEDNKKSFEQIAFVKDFGKFGWYFGSAVFVDDFTKKVQNEALEAVSKLRFDNNYIFIDTFDGYALLMNGKKLDKPAYVNDVADKNGFKVIQEQLRVAKSSKEGGYLEYIWHELSLGEDMPHLSFCRAMDDWGWKIGSGLYIGKINKELEERKKIFSHKLLEDTIIIIFILLLFIGVGLAIIYAIDKKMLNLFNTMNDKIDSFSSELVELNETLEKRVEEESSRRLEQEALIVQQAKMAMVGEMMDAIAHQWKQPLAALSILVDDIDMQHKSGEISKDDMAMFRDDAHNCIESMSQTLNEFREFFKPSKERLQVSVLSLISGVTKMMARELKMENISLIQDVDEELIVDGYKNELSQVILNIISNAKYAIKQNGNKDGEISIKAYKKESGAVIEIHDNGGGIDTALLPSKLFEHRVSTKGGGGSGVGLWMSHLVVQKHGGQMIAYNKNNGAVFEITLPTA